MRDGSRENAVATDFLSTKKGKSQSQSIEIPAINLPKGGGAIKGIDEKFSVNAANGTASFSIPLPFANARGASPSLNLAYNSGAGNGPFGLGWRLSLPSIKRKTDKELPQYLDEIDSDTFLFSEAEDLVPEFRTEPDGSFALDGNGDYVIDEKDSPDHVFKIRLYRPRVEGLFARIERWRHKVTGEIKWRVITGDNSTTLFGWTSASRISDPSDLNKIYEWLPEFVYDDKGNCARYVYKSEDAAGVDRTSLHNRNRISAGSITYSNVYLQRVVYGNRTPYKNFGDAFNDETDFMFRTVFDYGEHAGLAPSDPVADWGFRSDAFSEYKAGFEIRTTRLCRRVLLYHYFDELPGGSALVSALEIDYDTATQQSFTFLKSFCSRGYLKKADGTYTDKKLPSIEFEYQKHEWNREVKAVLPEYLENAPSGLGDNAYQFTDLFNEGLAGIISEQSGGWFYKHNLGRGKFARARMVSPKPSFAGLGDRFQLTDLDSDGSKQFVNYSAEPRGFFELDDDDRWQPFRTFDYLPNVDLRDPNLRMLDLNGDGRADALLSDESIFTWYESTGRAGFSAGRKTSKPFDEESGPAVLFADSTETIFLADMKGDGMTDIVRIRNGEICYWPNLGYGRFGAKVWMDNAPVFDSPDYFNPAKIRLADIDGSGTADIVYLGRNRFSCWMNLCGSSFSATPVEINPSPELFDSANVNVIDLLGNGISCIVWSSNLEKHSRSPLFYVDLMNGKKPHLMTGYRNNLGKEVSIQYTPSTHFYLEDKLAGKPWISKLHFPVHCLSQTETRDRITGHRFVSTYKYHHGYYDHAEREFRGFGLVEQLDTETFENWEKGNASNVVEAELHQAPVYVKSWFHTGAFLRHESISEQFAREYWHEEMRRAGFTVVNPETRLPDARIIAAPGIDANVIADLAPQEIREAYRACKGMALRSETFAKDAPSIGATRDQIKLELTPYGVATHNCVIELLQPKGKNKHAVFIVKESEAVIYSYERKTDDPRIAHNLNLKFDRNANVLESAVVVYPRQVPQASLPVETRGAQARTIITFTENQFTNSVSDDDNHRLPAASEVKTWELKGVTKSGSLCVLSDFPDVIAAAEEAQYHEIDRTPAAGTVQKRLIEHLRTTYYDNVLNDPLPLGRQSTRGINFETYQLAFTPALIDDIFGARADDTLMLDGRYTHSEGDLNWWIRSGSMQYRAKGESLADAENRFFVPVSYTDPYQAKTKVRYFSDYFLFINETEDALGNRSRVDLFNFRTLSPQRMRDINDNISEVISDELGLVKALAIMGKGSEADELTGLSQSNDAAEIAAIASFFNAGNSVQLTSRAKVLLKRATSRFVYDLDAYERSGGTMPSVVASISREEHFEKLADSPVQIAFEYSGGMGQVVMKKAQAEPGIAKKVTINVGDTYSVADVDTSANIPKQLRWIGNGRTVLNNKGNPVKQYEPYFSVTHEFEDVKELVETGVTPLMYYDPPGRLIRTDLPDGTFSKVEFDSWKQAVYDTNDTVLETDWYNDRTNRAIDARLTAEGKDPAKEKVAADKAADHANTPNTLHFDTLGRAVLSIEHNRKSASGPSEFYLTRVELDVEGNLRRVVDARGNTVMEYQYDMLGNAVYQKSMDAGRRWLLTNIVGNPLRTWDERGHEYRYSYDILHRPTHSKVTGGDGVAPLDRIFDRLIYGEDLLSAGRANEAALQADNVLGRAVKHYDTGGLVDTPRYDFKGQPLATTRRLFRKYKEVANWTDANLTADLETDQFTFTTETDALGRITEQSAPDGSIITPSYNEAGMLNSEKVLLAGSTVETEYIKDIDYNEKGQRNKIIYGNGVVSKFSYDAMTFRLNRVESKRQNGDPLQDWRYTFDAVGNVTHIEDKNIPVVFFDNQKITGVAEYSYDSLYRLISASGRENDSAMTFGPKDNWSDEPFMKALNPGDPVALRNYSQSYQYDSVGNILEMRHQSTGTSWTRNYSYESANNRLIGTTLGANTYTYDHHPEHGFIRSMPHLVEIGWNFKEELVKTIRQRVANGGTPETTYYQYDGRGQRIRKVTENQAAPGAVPTKKNERIYLAGYEVCREASGANTGLERTSLSLMDAGHRFVTIETRNNIDDGTEKQLTRYQLHNHLGSACLELDSTARVISYEEFHPYGTTAYQAKNSAIRSAGKRYRYTGMERDEETGLEYHSARYYVPWLGRWLSPDPIGIGDGTCLYQYSRSNVINRSDEKGTQSSKQSELNDVRLAFARGMVRESISISLDMNQVINPALMILSPFRGAIGLNTDDLRDEQDSDAQSLNPALQAMNNFYLSEQRTGKALDQFKSGNTQAAAKEAEKAGASLTRFVDALGTLITIARAGQQLLVKTPGVLKAGMSKLEDLGSKVKDSASKLKDALSKRIEMASGGRLQKEAKEVLDSTKGTLNELAEKNLNKLIKKNPNPKKGLSDTAAKEIDQADNRMRVRLDQLLEEGVKPGDAVRTAIKEQPALRRHIVEDIRRAIIDVKEAEKAVKSVGELPTLLKGF